jgi:hypothetical protein
VFTREELVKEADWQIRLAFAAAHMADIFYRKGRYHSAWHMIGRYKSRMRYAGSILETLDA